MNPGTVSKILWHFTGGPLWNEILNKQENQPKPVELSYDILIKILESQELRISKYSELIRVLVPEIPFWNWEEKKIDVKYNTEQTIKSSKVACLADIPIQHLDYHSKRYGKFAIGFHRDSAIKNNFNPVFYSLQNSPIMNSIYSGLSIINSSTETYHIKSQIKRIDNLLDDIKKESFRPKNETNLTSFSWIDIKSNLEYQVDNLEKEIKATKESLSDFVAFVKTFNDEEFNSIYCEREWRTLNPFNFSFDDIAMIVLPRKGGFFENLIQQEIIPRQISIMAWEDLVEH